MPEFKLTPSRIETVVFVIIIVSLAFVSVGAWGA